MPATVVAGVINDMVR